MGNSQQSWPVDRRTILKTGAAVAATQLASPFIIQARGETPVRIGLVDPLTGVYAAIAQNEVVGAKFAAEHVTEELAANLRVRAQRVATAPDDVSHGHATSLRPPRLRPTCPTQL